MYNVDYLELIEKLYPNADNEQKAYRLNSAHLCKELDVHSLYDVFLRERVKAFNLKAQALYNHPSLVEFYHTDPTKYKPTYTVEQAKGEIEALQEFPDLPPAHALQYLKYGILSAPSFSDAVYRWFITVSVARNIVTG